MGIFGGGNKEAMEIYQISRDSSSNQRTPWTIPTAWEFVGVANGAYQNSVSLWFKDRNDGTLRVTTAFFDKEGDGKLILGDHIGELKQA